MKHPKITLLAHFCRKFNGFIETMEHGGTLGRYFGNKLGLTPNAENMMQIGYHG